MYLKELGMTMWITSKNSTTTIAHHFNSCGYCIF